LISSACVLPSRLILLEVTFSLVPGPLLLFGLARCDEALLRTCTRNTGDSVGVLTQVLASCHHTVAYQRNLMQFPVARSHCHLGS
jgi:hypothetical protein